MAVAAGTTERRMGGFCRWPEAALFVLLIVTRPGFALEAAPAATAEQGPGPDSSPSEVRETTEADQDQTESQESAENNDTPRIVITGTLQAPDPRSLPEQISVITAEQIAAAAPTSLAGILEPIPGVAVTRYGGSSAAAFVSIRGASAEQVLVLVNGRRRNSAQGGGVDLSAINPDSIERIEVYRGGMSAVYGDAAVGGVINIVLKKNERDPFHLSAGIGYASFRTITSSVGLQLWSQQHGGASLHLHGLSSAGSERRNADVLRGGMDLRLSLQSRQNLELELDAGYMQDEKGVPGMLQFPSASARMQDARAGLGAELTWGLVEGNITLGGAYSRRSRSYRDPDFFLGAVDDWHRNSAWEFDAAWQQLSMGSRLAADWQASYSLRHDLLASSSIGGDDTLARLRHALSLQAEVFPLGDGPVSELRLFPAARVDIWHNPYRDSSQPELLPSAKIGLLVPLDRKQRLQLKSTTGTAFRTPSFDDLFWPATAFAEGNPELVPEKSWFIDGGIIVTPLSGLVLEAAGFYRGAKNLIQWTPGPSGTWRPINIGQAVFYGGELELRGLADIAVLDATGEVTVNGTLISPQDLTPASATYRSYLPRRPLWQSSATTTLTHTDGHSLQAQLRHVGVRYITAANTKRLEPYSVLDLSARAAAGDAFMLTASVKNLLDTEYIDVREYPVPGRELQLEVRYAF